MHFRKIFSLIPPPEDLRPAIVRIRVFLLFLLMLLAAVAKGEDADTLVVRDTIPKEYKYLPDYMKLQYAGGIGFLSLGAGYTFIQQRLDISFFYGYVPKGMSIHSLHSISIQLTAKFLKYKVKNVEILPLNFGWYVHHTFGNQFWVTLPDKYTKGYYWWSPGRTAGIFLGGEIKTKLFVKNTPAAGTAFYVRLGSRGLYIASKFGNATIPLKDILKLGLGIAIYR
jgi:hypothetical protein